MSSQPKPMKTIGILGGMSATSTLHYYQHLLLLTSQSPHPSLGGLHSPSLLIRSLDFAPIATLQAAGSWYQLGDILNAEALALERGGAEILVLATNTMHKVAGRMMEGVGVPMLHLADATAGRICAAGSRSGGDGGKKLKRPGLLATRFTMEEAFYVERLRGFGLEPVVPGREEREVVHRIIYEELCKGVVEEGSREVYVAIAERLVREQGADCLILGCTEVGMLLNQGNVSVPVFDTTIIHCEEALKMALDER